MSDINPTRRTDELPARDGAPLAGWPTTIAPEEAVALRGALGQLQTALDAVVRERDEARAKAERLREALIEWDALIQHQYSGSRDAMTDMQYAIFTTRRILDELDAPKALEAKS